MYNAEQDIRPPKADFSAPPPYEMNEENQTLYDQRFLVQSRLPTYEDVQREKILNGEPRQFTDIANGNQVNSLNELTSNRIAGEATLGYIGVDIADSENQGNDNNLLGTDVMFLTAFIISFLFNWIGFLMLTCFCHTIAARYGSLSGFGLSLAKWTLIVKHSTDLASHENSWLWWLIMAFGFLICIRAFLQYMSIKRTWRLLSTSDQERLLFFY